MKQQHASHRNPPSLSTYHQPPPAAARKQRKKEQEKNRRTEKNLSGDGAQQSDDREGRRQQLRRIFSAPRASKKRERERGRKKFSRRHPLVPLLFQPPPRTGKREGRRGLHIKLMARRSGPIITAIPTRSPPFPLNNNGRPNHGGPPSLPCYLKVYIGGGPRREGNGEDYETLVPAGSKLIELPRPPSSVLVAPFTCSGGSISPENKKQEFERASHRAF